MTIRLLFRQMTAVDPDAPGPLDAPRGWLECEQDGCHGVTTPGYSVCLPHLPPAHHEASVDAMLAAGVVDLRGTRLSGTVFDAILRRVPRQGDRPVLPALLLDEATIVSRFSLGEAWYAGAVVEGVASFRKARFDERAAFIGVRFLRDVSFAGCVFGAEAQFDGNATFHRHADFSRIQVVGWTSFIARAQGTVFFEESTFEDISLRGHFAGPVTFKEATATGRFEAKDATFGGGLDLSEAHFTKALTLRDVTVLGGLQEPAVLRVSAYLGSLQAVPLSSGTPDGSTPQIALSLRKGVVEGHVSMENTLVGGSADMQLARFIGSGALSGLTVDGNLDLTSADFAGVQLGAVAVRQTLCLDDATFRYRIDGAVDATDVTARSTRFVAGGRFQVQRAAVWLDRASLPTPLLLTTLAPDNGPTLASGAPRTSAATGGTKNSGGQADALDKGHLPSRAAWPEAKGLARLCSIDAADVAGVTIAELDLETCGFTGAQNLDKLKLQTLDHLPLARGRRLLAEEVSLRQKIPGRGRVRDAQFSREAAAAEAHAIASTYRSLRKGLEDAKNEPGAADLYYGEMEMRRLAARRFGAEWWVLTLYWLTSGYALRGSRALMSLAVVLVASAASLDLWGVLQPISFVQALLYSGGVAVSVPGLPGYEFNDLGQALRIVLKLSGPLFLGLAILSLRGRIKR